MSTDAKVTALATREFTDQQIHTRIKAAAEPGFGLAKATPAQLNMIYLLAKHYDVDPAVDITLYRDRPWFTIDGRVRLMKRHPQYRGYVTKPLPQAEKAAWGYQADDLVVECTIRTRDWGEIVARGKVTATEMKASAPTGSHPSEMAEKRAIARASRLAFGQDVPDEDAADEEAARRRDATQDTATAARYTELFGSEEEGTFFDQPAPALGAPSDALADRAEQALDHAAPAPAGDPKPKAIREVDGRLVDTASGEVLEERVNDGQEQPVDHWADNRRLVATANEMHLTGVPTLSSRSSRNAVAEANRELAARIRAENARLDQQLAAQPQQAF